MKFAIGLKRYHIMMQTLILLADFVFYTCIGEVSLCKLRSYAWTSYNGGASREVDDKRHHS